MTIPESNKMIARFMGLVIRPKINGYSFVELNDMEVVHERDLEYHSSWEWLMPVAIRLARIHDVYVNLILCEIAQMTAWASIEDNRGEKIRIINKHSEDPLTATYEAVVEFLIKYNIQK